MVVIETQMVDRGAISRPVGSKKGILCREDPRRDLGRGPALLQVGGPWHRLKRLRLAAGFHGICPCGEGMLDGAIRASSGVVGINVHRLGGAGA